MTNEIYKLRLHLIYLVSILTFVLVIVATDHWTSQPKFTEFLSNAATMTSLVLALVAIFYAFISNSSLSQSLGNISKVSEEVIETKDEIEKFLDHSIEIEKSGKENTRTLLEISQSVENHVVSLKQALEGVTEKTVLLQEFVGKLPEKFDRLETRLLEASMDNAAKYKFEAITKKNEKEHALMANNFLEISSLSGRFLIYGCVLAKSSGKNISIPIISKMLGSEEAYLHGYFIAMIAAGFIENEDVKDEIHTYKILAVDETIMKEAKASLTSRIATLWKDDETLRNKYTELLKGLEQIFNVSGL